MIVGNLLTDPAAQSFISRSEALAYLAPEAPGAAPAAPIAQWMAALEDAQDASLIRASRWLAGAYRWNPLSDADLIRVGYVAARLAAETFGRGIFAGDVTADAVAREKVASIEVEYRSDVTADVAGLSLPWLKPMLRGLIVETRLGFGIMVI